WNVNANWSGNSPAAYEDVIIQGSRPNNPSLNMDRQVSSIWIQPNAVLTLNTGRTFSVAYDITNCGSISGNGTSVLLLNSSNPYTQNQHLSGDGTFNLTNLTINNTYSVSPQITLSKNVSVSANLNLTSGIVNTSATNILALGNAATANSGSANSFV